MHGIATDLKVVRPPPRGYLHDRKTHGYMIAGQNPRLADAVVGSEGEPVRGVSTCVDTAESIGGGAHPQSPPRCSNTASVRLDRRCCVCCCTVVRLDSGVGWAGVMSGVQPPGVAERGVQSFGWGGVACGDAGVRGVDCGGLQSNEAPEVSVTGV